jgi:hypothetical protein
MRRGYLIAFVGISLIGSACAQEFVEYGASWTEDIANPKSTELSAVLLDGAPLFVDILQRNVQTNWFQWDDDSRRSIDVLGTLKVNAWAVGVRTASDAYYQKESTNNNTFVGAFLDGSFARSWDWGQNAIYIGEVAVSPQGERGIAGETSTNRTAGGYHYSLQHPSYDGFSNTDYRQEGTYSSKSFITNGPGWVKTYEPRGAGQKSTWAEYASAWGITGGVRRPVIGVTQTVNIVSSVERWNMYWEEVWDLGGGELYTNIGGGRVASGPITGMQYEARVNNRIKYHLRMVGGD